MTDDNPAMAMTVEDFLEYVEKSKSKHTFKEYRRGIKKFSAHTVLFNWYKGDPVFFGYVEVGFEYVTGEYTDGGKIFRKRK